MLDSFCLFPRSFSSLVHPALCPEWLSCMAEQLAVLPSGFVWVGIREPEVRILILSASSLRDYHGLALSFHGKSQLLEG